jgi:polysaccharide export outer membrane protein
MSTIITFAKKYIFFRILTLLFSKLTVTIAVLFALESNIAAADLTPMPLPDGPESIAPKTPPGGSVDKSYKIYPGDLMKVEVFDHPDLTIQVHIPANGRITFPLIGDVNNIIARSVEDLNTELKKRLEDGYITTAIITISFLDFGPRTVYVMGCVKNPTAISLSPFSATTAMQAISKAGGFSDGANRLQAHVVRNDLSNPGRKIAVPIPANDDPTSMGKDFVLDPDDIVIIPRLDRIFILGQVKKPGAIDLPSSEDITVSKAIGIAGGFERFGRQSEVQVIRDGKAIFVVDVKAVLNGAKVEDPKLKPGDTVFVPETRF